MSVCNALERTCFHNCSPEHGTKNPPLSIWFLILPTTLILPQISFCVMNWKENREITSKDNAMSLIFVDRSPTDREVEQIDTKTAFTIREPKTALAA